MEKSSVESEQTQFVQDEQAVSATLLHLGSMAEEAPFTGAVEAPPFTGAVDLGEQLEGLSLNSTNRRTDIGWIRNWKRVQHQQPQPVQHELRSLNLQLLEEQVRCLRYNVRNNQSHAQQRPQQLRSFNRHSLDGPLRPCRRSYNVRKNKNNTGRAATATTSNNNNSAATAYVPQSQSQPELEPHGNGPEPNFMLD